MTLTYNLSTHLKKNIRDVEDLRSDIVLCVLSPIEEIRLRWQTTIDRIYYWLHLANLPTTRKEISIVLTHAQKPQKTPLGQHIVNYRLALHTLYVDWLGNPEPLTIKNIQQIADSVHYVIPKTADLSHTLAYLQAGTTIHPLVQAAIIHLQFATTPIAHLAPLMVLYQHGFDLRGMLCPEALFYEEKERYFKTMQQMSDASTITLWLELYTETLVRNAQHIKQLLHETKRDTVSSQTHHFNLTSRQKSILSCFDEPGAALTNKNIQERFKISQITASRDLSRLATLGFLFPRGKGRSTHYTRV